MLSYESNSLIYPHMFDLKILTLALEQIQEERGISREKLIGAIERALASAYKKEYGKTRQMIEALFDVTTGTIRFEQVKLVVDEDGLLPEGEEREGEDDLRVFFNEEEHILLRDAQLIKANVVVGEKLRFPLEEKTDFGRIATQTAKQVIIQQLRDAEREVAVGEFLQKKGTVVNGTVRRMERRNVYVDLGRTIARLPHTEQIPGERYKQGERIRAYITEVNSTGKGGSFVVLSRSHPNFIVKLFENESPEVVSGTVLINSVAREAGKRTKLAVSTNDEYVDPVGALVGQRGVRVSAVTGELHGERIDIIEYSNDPVLFIEDALQPAQVLSVEVHDDEGKKAVVHVAEDQVSLAIGIRGQNVRLASKLTGWNIDIESPAIKKDTVVTDEESTVAVDEEVKAKTNEKDPEEKDVKEDTEDTDIPHTEKELYNGGGIETK